MKKLREDTPKNKKELSDCRIAICKEIEREFKTKTKDNQQAQQYIEALNEMVGRKFKKFESEAKKKNSQEA